MKIPTPIREAQRVFLVTLLARAVTFAVGIAVALALPHDMRPILVGISPSLLVAAVAVVPWFEKVLGERFLAVALSLDVLIMSLQMIPVFFRRRALFPELDPQSLESAFVEPFLLLLIPLVLLGWAYGRRGALWGSTWATLLHLGTGLWGLQWDFFAHGSITREIPRVALLYAVPLIVSTLAQRERKQLSELETANARLRRHTETVEQLAVSRERNRLARDLHDTLAHSLAGLTVQLEALRKLLIHDPAAAQDAVGEAVSLARRGLEESRQAISALRSDPVDTLGLVGAVRKELQALEARAGVSVNLDVAGQEPDLTGEEAHGLLRIAEEALANIERHASASQVTVRLAFGVDRIDVTIRDNGVGFDQGTVTADHYGLMGMQERAAMIQATLEVHSRSGHGTEVRCTLVR